MAYGKLRQFKGKAHMTRSALARKMKTFDFEEKLLAAASAVELHSQAWRGQWLSWRPGVSCRDFDADAQALAASLTSGEWFLAQARVRDADRATARGAVSAAGQSAEPNLAPFAADAVAIPTNAAPIWENVVVDLGCGKGERTVEMARLNPRTLYIGLDNDPVCTLQSAETAVAAGVSNAVFPMDMNPLVTQLFAPGEIARLELSYPTPFPNKKHAPHRLTTAERLLDYRSVLDEGGMLWLTTDSQPLFDYTLVQLDLAGYRIVRRSDDYRAAQADAPMGHYEQKTVAKGARVFALEAVPEGDAPDPASLVHNEAQSLYAYLPENLDELEYVPHGMEGAVENERRRRTHAKNKGTLRPGWHHGNGA